MAAAGLTLGAAVLFGVWTVVAQPTVQLSRYVGPAALSVLFGTGVQILIIESVRRSELSRTIPLLSFTPVATMLFGVVVLRELPTPGQWVGILLVFAGGLGLGLSRVRGAGEWRLPFDSGGTMMLAAALLISAAAPFDKLAVGASSVEFHGLVQSGGTGVLLVTFLGLRGDLTSLGRALTGRPALLLAAILALAAVALQFTAYRGAMVGVVETVKRVIGLASSLLAGALIFRERVTQGKFAALSLMGVGVALMLLC